MSPIENLVDYSKQNQQKKTTIKTLNQNDCNFLALTNKNCSPRTLKESHGTVACIQQAE